MLCWMYPLSDKLSNANLGVSRTKETESIEIIKNVRLHFIKSKIDSWKYERFSKSFMFDPYICEICY
jgi:hypothetical protein